MKRNQTHIVGSSPEGPLYSTVLFLEIKIAAVMTRPSLFSWQEKGKPIPALYVRKERGEEKKKEIRAEWMDDKFRKAVLRKRLFRVLFVEILFPALIEVVVVIFFQFVVFFRQYQTTLKCACKIFTVS